MGIKLLINAKAKNAIKQLMPKNENISYISSWMEEDAVKCFLLYNDYNTCVSFALLHKCDHDPFNSHDRPQVFDFIYTFAQHRNKNYACKLLTHIKNNNNNVTAFCNNDISSHIFQKCGYILTACPENPCEIYRYPK